jgi:hypothetical protein
LKEVDVVASNGSEDTTTVDVDSLLEGLPYVGLFLSSIRISILSAFK